MNNKLFHSTLFVAGNAMVIGLTKESAGDDGFVWVDGSSIIAGGYTNWADDEPSNNQLEKCVLMMGLLDGKWKDYSCEGPVQYICQRKVGK